MGAGAVVRAILIGAAAAGISMLMVRVIEPAHVFGWLDAAAIVVGLSVSPVFKVVQKRLVNKPDGQKGL